MKRETIFNFIGLALLAICFLLALGRVFSRAGREADPDRINLRFAHWQLEGGVRDAFDEVAREYERLHPNVTVEQMAIPEKISKNWARTQLVGGTAPDLIQLGSTMGINDEVMARYFLPLGAAVEDVNPYNAGTDLETKPWRETFIDGLVSPPNYSKGLLEYYGIPSSMFTIRAYFNRRLWRAVTGGEKVPQTFEEFLAVCDEAQAYRRPDGEGIIAIAGSKYNAPFVMDSLFSSQTQKLTPELSPLRSLETTPVESALANLEGRWDWNTPAVQSGLELMMRTGKFMQPGFLSLGRDDALFYFAQERALMISSGSWDSSSLRQQVSFEIGVFRIPLPDRDHPRYGRFSEGEISEAGRETGLAFGITNASEHPEAALDFLQFLTSKTSNATFSRLSGWLPSVVGAELAESILPFEPIVDGTTGGFVPSLQIGADPQRIIDNFLYRLVGPNGSVADFTDEMERRFSPAVRSALDISLRNSTRTVTSQDAVIGSYQALQARHADDAEAAELQRKVGPLKESQTQKEAELAFVRYRLRQLDSSR